MPFLSLFFAVLAFKCSLISVVVCLFFSQLPYVSNVQVEPIVIQIDRLDLVLEENRDVDTCSISNRYCDFAFR